VASMKSLATMRHSRRLASFAQPMQTHPKCPKRPFHGDNTGSNPVGDANKIKNLEKIEPISVGLKGFDKKSTISLFLIWNLPFPHNLPRYPALRRPLYLCHGLRVYVHRHLEVGVAK